MIAVLMKLLLPILLSFLERKGVQYTGMAWYAWAYSRWLKDVGAEAPKAGIDDPQPVRRGRHDFNVFRRRRDERED